MLFNSYEYILLFLPHSCINLLRIKPLWIHHRIQSLAGTGFLVFLQLLESDLSALIAGFYFGKLFYWYFAAHRSVGG